MQTITQLEDLLVDRIAGQLDYLAVCKSFAPYVEAEADLLSVRTPAVLVVYAGLTAEPGDWGDYWLEYQFDLAVIAQNLRGEEEARRGEYGAYRVLDDLKTALIDHVLVAGLEPLAFAGESEVALSRERVIYEATYSVRQRSA